MLKTLVLSTVALIAAPVAVMAGDTATGSTAVTTAARPLSWTGFHAGLGVGGSLLSAKSDASADEWGWTAYDDVVFQAYSHYGASSETLYRFSALGSADVGYDYQISQSVVAGLFGGLDFGRSTQSHTTSDLSGRNQLISLPYPLTYLDDGDRSGTLSTKVEVGNSWNVGVRVGVVPFERTLVYALAGYSRANIKSSATLRTSYEGLGGAGDFGFTSATATSTWKGAPLVGAGIETALGGQVTLKLEYRHVNYGKIKSVYSYWNGPDGAVYQTDISQSKTVTTDSVRAVVSYRF